MSQPRINLATATTAEASRLTEYQDTVAKLARITIGELVVTSGEVVACDPLGELQEGAFEEHFPLGTYPVSLCIAELQNGLHVVAYAMVEFAKTIPVTWELARPWHSVSARMPDYYWVDSGTACFMDVDARALLADRFVSSNPQDAFRIELVRQIFEGRDGALVGTADLRLSNTSGTNCVIFETGWGDDWYCSYVGRDESGAICCLLTEFGVLDIEQVPVE